MVNLSRLKIENSEPGLMKIQETNAEQKIKMKVAIT